MTVLIILAAILLLIFVLLLIPILLEFEFSASNGEFKQKLVFRYGFIRFTLSPSEKKAKKNGKTEKKTSEKKQFSYDGAMQSLKKAKYIYKQVKGDVLKLLAYAGKHSVTFREIDTNIEFDFENPMHTGIATGVINGIVYNLLALTDNTVKLKKHTEIIQPLFRNSNFYSCKIYGIVRLKNVHIMVIMIKALKLYLKIRKYNKQQVKTQFKQ